MKKKSHTMLKKIYIEREKNSQNENTVEDERTKWKKKKEIVGEKVL